MAESVHVRVADASQVGEARRCVARIARDAGLGDTRGGEAAIVVTELANNLHRYGGGGEIVVQALQTTRGNAVEILSVDTGQGMTNVEACMSDGFSTGGTPGNGLGAVKRLSSEFDIFSRPGQGTVVLSRVYAENPDVSKAPLTLVWGAMSRQAPGEEVCGDTWRFFEKDGGASMLMADGLGHGPDAANAAHAVADIYTLDPFSGPARILAAAHKRVGNSRGAAVACAQLDFSTKLLRYCGVGNISGSLISGNDSRGLFSHNGTIGLQATKFQEFEYPWPSGGLLVIYSDGLQSRWDLQKYPGLYSRHPAIVAAVLARDFTRGRDDVTVFAMRLRA